MCNRKDVSFLTCRSYQSSPWGLQLGFKHTVVITTTNLTHKCFFPNVSALYSLKKGVNTWRLHSLQKGFSADYALNTKKPPKLFKYALLIRYFPAGKKQKTKKPHTSTWLKMWRNEQNGAIKCLRWRWCEETGRGEERGGVVVRAEDVTELWSVLCVWGHTGRHHPPLEACELSSGAEVDHLQPGERSGDRHDAPLTQSTALIRVCVAVTMKIKRHPFYFPPLVLPH